MTGEKSSMTLKRLMEQTDKAGPSQSHTTIAAGKGGIHKIGTYKNRRIQSELMKWTTPGTKQRASSNEYQEMSIKQ